MWIGINLGISRGGEYIGLRVKLPLPAPPPPPWINI